MSIFQMDLEAKPSIRKDEIGYASSIAKCLLDVDKLGKEGALIAIDAELAIPVAVIILAGLEALE